MFIDNLVDGRGLEPLSLDFELVAQHEALPLS